MRRFHYRRERQGITWVEVLIILLVFGGLAALLIPATNGAREAARKSMCNNRLKQIGLALLQYETQFQSFPCGARVRTDPKTDEWAGDWGPSWWWEIVPFADGSPSARPPVDPGLLIMSTAERG